MPPNLALFICITFVLGLLWVEHKQNPSASVALWIPTLWMLICASRSVSQWLDPQLRGGNIEEGDPLERLALSALMSLAVLVILTRKMDLYRIVKDNFWLILVFGFMGVSILWSEIQLVSLKRWIRSSGDILMALVVLSERIPLQSLESVLRRSAYVLIPFSLILVKYFPQYGRAYGRWSGGEMWTGVTVHKNSLGQLCALSLFILIFAFIREWKSGKLLKNGFQTLADVSVVGLAGYLLIGNRESYSATSAGVLIFGMAILSLLFWRKDLSLSVATHLKGILVSLSLIYWLLRDSMLQIVSSSLGRDETLTGRTEIWEILLEFAYRNPVFGVGYGGFYAPENLELKQEFGSKFVLAQSHNGYLAVFVELGMIGIVLLMLFLLAFCGKIRREFHHSFEWAIFGICFLPMLILHNFSEASLLQSSSYLWSIMVLLTIVFTEPRLNTDPAFHLRSVD